MKDEFQKLACDIIDKSCVKIDDGARADIMNSAVQVAMNHIATRMEEIPQPGLPYMKVQLHVWGRSSGLPRSALAVFISKADTRSLKTQVGAWFEGKVIYTSTMFCYQSDEHIEEAIQGSIRKMRKMAVLEQNSNYEEFLQLIKEEKNLELKADFVTPAKLLDILINQGVNDALIHLRETAYGTLCDMCRSQTDLVSIVVDTGKACDGAMVNFAGKVVRLANELPVIKQETKSYVTNHVTELLEPYRFESDQNKMIAWGTW